MISTWVHTFASDTKVHIALLLVAADFIFGVSAAVKLGTFRLSYLSDFLRNDILFKLLPYYALYVFALVAGNTNVIPGIDFGFLAGAAYAALVAAIGASILSSLRQLGFVARQPLDGKNVLFGPENAAPPKS